MSKPNPYTKKLGAIFLILVVLICSFPTIKETKASAPPLNSISVLWGSFQKFRDMDRFEPLYLQCASIFHTGSISDFEGVSKYNIEFFGYENLFPLVVNAYLARKPTATYDEAVLYVSDEVERYGKVYRNHGMSLLPPDNVSDDMESCLRDNCMLKFGMFISHIEEEASRCIKVVRWSER